MRFRTELPVQFRDIDRMGHVNHAVYLQYMETARVELARSLGMIGDVSSSGFILAMAHCEYNIAITNQRRVTILAWVSRIGGRSWDLDYSVRGPGVEFAIGRTTQVSYDYGSSSTVRISEKVKKRLAKYRGRPLRFREVH